MTLNRCKTFSFLSPQIHRINARWQSGHSEGEEGSDKYKCSDQRARISVQTMLSSSVIHWSSLPSLSQLAHLAGCLFVWHSYKRFSHVSTSLSCFLIVRSGHVAPSLLLIEARYPPQRELIVVIGGLTHHHFTSQLWIALFSLITKPLNNVEPLNDCARLEVPSQHYKSITNELRDSLNQLRIGFDYYAKKHPQSCVARRDNQQLAMHPTICDWIYYNAHLWSGDSLEKICGCLEYREEN